MQTRQIQTLISGLLMSFAAASPVLAQNAINSFNTPYLQSFAGQTPGILPTGWSEESLTGTWSWRPSVDDGASNAGGIRYYGSDLVNSTALGFLSNSGQDGVLGTWDYAFIAGFSNNTGASITELDIAYTAQQWRVGGGTPGRDSALGVFYRVDGGSWMEVAGLGFIAPDRSATGAALNPVLFSNLAETVLVTIAASSTFDIAWRYNGTATSGGGSRQGLAFTDVSVTAIPEPSTYAALLGLVAFASIMIRRRRQS